MKNNRPSFGTSFFCRLCKVGTYICLSMESIRLGGPAHGIVTKTVHKTLPGGGGGPGGGWVGGGRGPGGGLSPRVAG